MQPRLKSLSAIPPKLFPQAIRSLAQYTALALSLFFAPATTFAEVDGRYLRIEAPASSRMGIHEVEIWSGGTNIALQNKELKFAGLSHRGRDINERDDGRKLVDGKADLDTRSFELSTAEGVNPWVEIDLGSARPLQKVVIHKPRQPLYDDRAIRLVTILDDARQVVWAAVYDIRSANFAQGVATFPLAAEHGSLIGSTIPLRAAAWIPLGNLLEPAAAKEPPGVASRAERFAARHSPAALEQLAGEFFARLDLSRPELAAPQAKFEAGEFAAALDAYRDHFLSKLRGVEFAHEHPREQTPYAAAAEDLLRGVAVTFARSDAAAQAFTPGKIDWACVPEDDKGGIDLARVRARVGNFQLPLLTAYRQTGDPELMAQWCAIIEDWGMNIRADLDRAEQDLRFYFVKDLQDFNHLAEEIDRTARQQPDLARHLSGAALARLLIPVLEEYPPAYWWIARRASFNHTYNALNAATVTSRILDDFHAGQRLDRENRQHWQRVWTSKMTRDGSMNEIADEGHLFMHWRMTATVDRMTRTPPPWLTPDFLAEFATGWHQTAVYPIRHLAPDGLAHRMGRRGYFEKIWWLADATGGASELPASHTLDSAHILRHPEVEAIMQSVFGAGRDPATLAPEQKEIRDKVTAFYGEEVGRPTTASDWMPYAGLYYLRRSWEPGASFVAMISQPTGHPSTNGSGWNTEFHYYDYDQPLLACGPVWIDGQPLFNEADTLTYKPGSKTETLATASEFPIPGRWHTSPAFDYAESFFEGTYQSHGLVRGEDGRQRLRLGENPIEDVRTHRSLILFRPARLLIVTDSVQIPGARQPRRYELRQRFALPEGSGPMPGEFHGDASTLTLVNAGLPGLTIRRFTAAELSWDKRATPDAWHRGAAMQDHTGVFERMGGVLRAEREGDLLMSAIIEPHRIPGHTQIDSVTDLGRDGVTGFRARLESGGTLTWLATAGEPQPLEGGSISLVGAGLLVWEQADSITGLALGARSLSLDGEPQALTGTDFAFVPEAGQLATTPIHRPITPVTFSPQEDVFIDRLEVALSTPTPEVEIRYTLDGSEPDPSSPLYTAPLPLEGDAYIRARAFRPGLEQIPFTADGTQATVISDARYRRLPPKPAMSAPSDLRPGLHWELVEGNHFALFSHLHLPQVMPAAAAGETATPRDVSMRQGDGPFGVRYQGYLKIPSTGVWTFYAPDEYAGASCEPGYDLRVWIDGEEWDLGQHFHARHRWSIPLEKGFHHLKVTFADARDRDRTIPNSGLWRGYPNPWVTWQGEAPVIGLSGPSHQRAPLPDAWLHQLNETLDFSPRIR